MAAFCELALKADDIELMPWALMRDEGAGDMLPVREQDLAVLARLAAFDSALADANDRGDMTDDSLAFDSSPPPSPFPPFSLSSPLP